MKSARQDQGCPASPCADHEWQRLFNEPSCKENVLAYLSHGHADFEHCTQCGAVAMVESGASRRVHLLSESFANAKKREAAAWNARQQGGAPSEKSVVACARTR